MIAFAIALLHPEAARSWERVQELLARSLASVGAQTVPALAFVAGNVAPAHLPECARFVELDLPPVHRGSPGADAGRDKGLKFAAAAQAAVAAGASHVVLMDADDLVHRRLAESVARERTAPGSLVESGYAWWEGSRRITLVRPFHQLCGTSYALAAHVVAPEIHGRPLWQVFASHTRVAGLFSDAGTPLRPLDFPAAVWVRGTGENLTDPVGYLSILGRAIDAEQRCDFGLPGVARTPAAELVASGRQAAATWRVARRRGLAYGVRATFGRAPMRLWQTIRNQPWEPREPPRPP